MQRAFGGILIARTAAAANVLAVRFGLACVDLEGRVSRPGSLQASDADTRTPNKTLRQFYVSSCMHPCIMSKVCTQRDTAKPQAWVACRADGVGRQGASVLHL